MKNLINIAWDVIETNWYEMKIKRRIFDFKYFSFNFHFIPISFNYIPRNIN